MFACTYYLDVPQEDFAHTLDNQRVSKSVFSVSSYIPVLLLLIYIVNTQVGMLDQGTLDFFNFFKKTYIFVNFTITFCMHQTLRGSNFYIPAFQLHMMLVYDCG